MAWPKGKPRKMATVRPPEPDPVVDTREDAPQAAQDAPSQSIASPAPLDLGSVRRRICAHRVRRELIPRDIRVHDYMPLGNLAEVIRREMAKDGAADSEVEAYVAKHMGAE